MTRIVWYLVLLTVLGGCEQQRQKAEADKRDAALIMAKEAADARALAQGPLQPRVLAAGAHEVVVVEIPSEAGSGFVSTQRCYVWRDKEFRTATMSCPEEPRLTTGAGR